MGERKKRMKFSIMFVVFVVVVAGSWNTFGWMSAQSSAQKVLKKYGANVHLPWALPDDERALISPGLLDELGDEDVYLSKCRADRAARIKGAIERLARAKAAKPKAAEINAALNELRQAQRIVDAWSEEPPCDTADRDELRRALITYGILAKDADKADEVH